MFSKAGYYSPRFIRLLLLVVLAIFIPVQGQAEGYGNSLKGVKTFKALFDVSQGNPAKANVVFWAVKNAYQAPEVKTLSNTPEVAVVFHGAAVRLLSTDKRLFSEDEWPEVEKFQQTLRKMKKDGVKLEACQYAIRISGIDKKTILKEVDQVPNGFVSVIGYQLQGYAVVRLP